MAEGGTQGRSAAVRRARRRHGGGLGWYLVAGALISAVFVVPLGWEVLRSLELESAVSSAPSAASFSHLSMTNYQALLSGSDDIIRNVVNSLIVAILTAVLTAGVATLAGYGFGLFRFRGSGALFGLVLVAFMVPFQAVLTPVFLEMHDLHLLNSLAGLGLFYTAFTLPVALINVEAGNYGAINYGLLLAGAVIAMIPCIVVYVCLQRFYVRGLVSGALKG